MSGQAGHTVPGLPLVSWRTWAERVRLEDSGGGGHGSRAPIATAQLRTLGSWEAAWQVASPDGPTFSQMSRQVPTWITQETTSHWPFEFSCLLYFLQTSYKRTRWTNEINDHFKRFLANSGGLSQGPPLPGAHLIKQSTCFLKGWSPSTFCVAGVRAVLSSVSTVLISSCQVPGENK